METEVLEQSKTSEIVIIANRIDAGLKAFEQRKSDLIDLEREAHGLTIESIDDKVSINAVSTVRKKLKVARVEIEKEGKMMRDPLTNISRIISSKEKELIAIIEPTERELLEKEKWVESEKERIRKEAEEKEAQRIQARIDRLAEFGYAIDLNFLKSLPDADFEKVVENAKAEHEKELAAKAEAERLRQEEEVRLKAEREELERLRAQQAKAQRIIDEQNARIKKEQEEREAAIRAEELRVENAKRELELQKQREEEDRKRAAELEQVRKDAAEKARLQAIEEGKREAKEKEEAELRVKLLEVEKLAQSSDKVKFKTVIDQLKAITIPEMKSSKAKKLSLSVNELIGKVIVHIETSI